MSAENVANRIALASGGNFLYVVWLLRAIAKGVQRFDVLEALPPGLDGVYREFLRTRRLGDDKQAWRTSYRPLLGILAAARQALTVDQLENFAHLEEQDIQDMLIDVEQFLEPSHYARHRYQLFHQSVVDFLGDKGRAEEFWIGSAWAHRQIIAFFKGKTPNWSEVDWKRADDYALLHLASHIYALRSESAMRGEVYELISRPYMLEKRIRFGSDRAFTVDLVLGLDAAAAEVPPNLVEETRISLVYATLASIANDMPSNALGALAWTGRTERALDYAIAQGGSVQIRSYELICEALLDKGEMGRAKAVVQLALEALRCMKKRDRQFLLGRIIPGAIQTGEVASVLKIIGHPSDHHDADFDPRPAIDSLVAMASALAENGQSMPAAEIAEQLVRLPSFLQGGGRAQAFAAIGTVKSNLGHPVEAEQAARQALTETRTLVEPRVIMAAAHRLVPVLVAVGLIDDALAVPDLLPEGSPERAMVLSRLARPLMQAGDPGKAVAVARRALDVANALPEAGREEALPDVMNALLQVGCVEEAQTLAHSFQSENSQDRANQFMATAAADARNWDVFLKIVEDTKNPEWARSVFQDANLHRAPMTAIERALKLGPIAYLPAHLEVQGALALALARHFDPRRALSLFERIVSESMPRDEETLVLAFCSIAKVFASAGDTQRAKQIAKYALSRLKVLGNDSPVRALGSIAEVFASAGDTQRAKEIAKDALSWLRVSGNKSAIGSLLYDVMPVLVATGLIPEVLAILKLEPNASYRGRTQGRLAKAVLDAGQSDAALSIAASIDDPYRRGWALREMAESFARSHDQGRAATSALGTWAAAREIHDGGSNAEALKVAAIALAWAEKDEDTQVVLAEMDEVDKKAAQAELARIAAQQRVQGAQGELVDVPGSEEDAGVFIAASWNAIQAGRNTQAVELANKALAVAEQRSNWGQAGLFNDIALVLYTADDATSARMVAERALIAAEAMMPPRDGPKVSGWQINPSLPLTAVAPSVCRAGLVERLVSDAISLTDENSRAEALSGIAVAVAEVGDVSRAVEIWRSALKVARTAGFWKLISTLEVGSSLIFQIDGGDTLSRIYDALCDVERWWS